MDIKYVGEEVWEKGDKVYTPFNLKAINRVAKKVAEENRVETREFSFSFDNGKLLLWYCMNGDKNSSARFEVDEKEVAIAVIEEEKETLIANIVCYEDGLKEEEREERLGELEDREYNSDIERHDAYVMLETLNWVLDVLS